MSTFPGDRPLCCKDGVKIELGSTIFVSVLKLFRTTMFSQTTIRKFTAKSLEGKASKKQLEDHEAELLKNTNAEAKKTSADIVNAQKLLENVEKKKAAATARAASVAEEKLVFLESKNLPRRKKRN